MTDLAAAANAAPPRTLVTVATYNERENLPTLVERIFRAAPYVDLLVIDDNSPDGTGQWVEDAARNEPRLRCLHRAGKLGLGTAVVAGLKYAIEHGYTYVVNLDADLSHPPERLPALVEGMDPDGGRPVDVMIGSRYVAGGRIEGWPWRRHLMSRGVNLYARLLLGLSVRDTSGSYRCYRVAKLSEVDWSAIRSRGYSFMEEVLWRLKRVGCRMGETPITFTDRVRGQSKINGAEARAAVWILLRLGVTNWLGV